jgi:hypothetical protein
MGMMDGGDNFKDKCHACNGTAMGGTMLRSIDDRNKKICSNCHNKLSDEDKNKFVTARQLKQGLFI